MILVVHIPNMGNSVWVQLTSHELSCFLEHTHPVNNWFQIRLWYVLAYYCFWLFILHLHHQNVILEKILERLMAYDFEEKRMTMLFPPELQNVFIFTFTNPNWNDQIDELCFYIIHFFFPYYLWYTPAFSISPLVKHLG